MKQNKCALCGTSENLEHHHVIPKQDGGTDDEANILTLCSEHHAALHGITLTKERKGWGSPNRIRKGQYANHHTKRGDRGRFVKKEEVKDKRTVCLYEHEWEFIDKAKRGYKCGRGGFISILLEKYMNEYMNEKLIKNPLEELLGDY